MKFLTSSISLIFVNLLPILGAIFLGWDIYTLLLIYWSENVVVGIFTVIKILKAENILDRNGKYKIEVIKPQTDPAKENDKKGSYLGAFLFTYGGFCLIHGIILMTIVSTEVVNIIALILNMVIGFALIFISHLISYKTNYIDKEEYKNTSVVEIFIRSFKRIFIIQFTMVILFFLLRGVDNLIAVSVMVVIKIIADLIGHRSEHMTIKRVTFTLD